jgi:hypothetical protein
MTPCFTILVNISPILHIKILLQKLQALGEASEYKNLFPLLLCIQRVKTCQLRTSVTALPRCFLYSIHEFRQPVQHKFHIVYFD